MEPGDSLAGYVVEKRLGSGAMGSVYLCHAPDDPSRRVAAKCLPVDPSTEVIPDGGVRFRREAEVLGKLDHPCIASFVGWQDEPPVLLMEFVEGVSLHRLFVQGPMPDAQVAELGRQIADALAYIHHRGVWHRDVKPDNVIVDNTGRPRLVDFGIAVSEDWSRLTQAGMFLGTLPYVPPEGLLEDDAPDPESWDVYSLGVMLWELSTGQLAFAKNDGKLPSPGDVVTGKEALPHLDPGEGVHEDLRELVRRMTARDYEDRLSRARSVADRLGTIHERVSIGAVPTQAHERKALPTAPPSVPQSSPRSGWWLGLLAMLGAPAFASLALVFVFAVLVGGYLLWPTADADGNVDLTVVVAGVPLDVPVEVEVDGMGPLARDRASFWFGAIPVGRHGITARIGTCDTAHAADRLCCSTVSVERRVTDFDRVQVLTAEGLPTGPCGEAVAAVEEEPVDAAPSPFVATRAPATDATAPTPEAPSPSATLYAPTHFAAERSVGVEAFQGWLEDNGKYARKRALAKDLADEGYLVGQVGDGPATSVSFVVARAYCASRGGLARVKDGPWHWNGAPDAEVRIRDGQPAVRRNDGTVRLTSSTATDPSIGFRCRR